MRFGTSGVRGVLGDDFTFAGARALVGALAESLAGSASTRPTRGSAARGGARVVVAYDTRFLGGRLAQEAAAVLHAAGLRPCLAKGPTPTPAACLAVRRRRAAAGVIFTASHNSPEYQGIKIVGPDGAAAARSLTDRLEAATARRLARGREPARLEWTRTVDLNAPYRAHLGQLAAPLPAAGPGLRLVYDPLHGAGVGVLDRWLIEAGCTVSVLHGDPDPTFGGAAPDPGTARLAPLGAEVRRRRARFGLASDGDADRFAVVDGRGRRISESDALALIIDYLAGTRRLGRGVALSIATGSLPERVARAHGLPVLRVGLGFRALSTELLAGRADLAGEESGGFAWAPAAIDKDGMLASALLTERLARDRRPVAQQLRSLHRRHGSSACGRLALPATAARRARLTALGQQTPARIDGCRVLEARHDEGLHCRLSDGGFVMWRASGTEPVVRVYAEAGSRAGLRRRLRLAVRRLGRGG